MATLTYTPISLTATPTVQLTATTETVLYTASKATIVRQIVITNTDTTNPVTVGVSLTNGAGGAAANRVVADAPVAAGQTTVFDCELVLPVNGKLTAKASAANKVNVGAAGVTFE